MDVILDKFSNSGRFDRFVVLSGKKNPSDFVTTHEVEYVRDLVEDGGPLIALYSLMLQCSDDDVIFLHGGDMPFTSPELSSWLLDRLNEGYDVAIFKTSRGMEPLFAWYRASVKSQVEKAIEKGEKRVVSFFEDVKVFVADLTKTDNLCQPELFFFNVNTEEDYKKAVFLFENTCEEKS